MKNKQANQILRAWDLAEKISGGELDKKAKWFSGDIRKTAYQKRESGTINEKISQNNQSSDQHVTISLLYLGAYKKNKIYEIAFKIFILEIRKWFKIVILLRAIVWH
ncbi:hypothetical protein O209_10385 [Lactiplantibacillus plantarum WHE 92]|nr:hypothetical protein O209_10385 [Lactiplantibacillus plantarum WHE 92]